MTKSKQKMPPGPAVLILLIATVVAATAAPTNAPTIFDTDARAVRAAYAMTPTCGADARAKELPPCHPGYERSPSSRLCAPDCKPYCMKSRIAEAQRPMPVPQTGAGCPPGYSSSPTSGACSPSAGTRCRAVPRVGTGCPAGYSLSPTSNYCVETNCH
jgi:hypothetical protein